MCLLQRSGNKAMIMTVLIKSRRESLGVYVKLRRLQFSSNIGHTHFYFTNRYASTVLAVVIMPVRPFVCHTRALCQNKIVHCGYFDTTRKSITLIFSHLQWLAGDAPLCKFCLKFAFKVTNPTSKNAHFDRVPPVTSQL